MSNRTTEILETTLGTNGGDYIADTGAHTGTWNGGIYIVAEATFGVLTGNVSGATTTFPANATIKGKFTAITLSGGSIIAYK